VSFVRNVKVGAAAVRRAPGPGRGSRRAAGQAPGLGGGTAPRAGRRGAPALGGGALPR